MSKTKEWAIVKPSQDTLRRFRTTGAAVIAITFALWLLVWNWPEAQPSDSTAQATSSSAAQVRPPTSTSAQNCAGRETLNVKRGDFGTFFEPRRNCYIAAFNVSFPTEIPERDVYLVLKMNDDPENGHLHWRKVRTRSVRYKHVINQMLVRLHEDAKVPNVAFWVQYKKYPGT